MPDRRVVGAADDAQQIARVVEQAARAGRFDHLLQDGDGEMRLADARLPFEKQPALLAPREMRPATRRALTARALERLVVGREVRERAVLIALGNVRSRRGDPDRLARASSRSERRGEFRFASIGFQPVSSQNSQGIRSCCEGQSTRKYISDARLAIGQILRYVGLSVVRTRSVGDDLTSAVDSRCFPIADAARHLVLHVRHEFIDFVLACARFCVACSG